MPPKCKVTPKRRQASDEPAITPAPVSVSRRTRASVSGPPARDSPSSSARETPRAARSSRAPASSSRRSQPREEEYIVEKLLDREIASDGRIFYKVKWQGYQDSDSTWEPVYNLDCPQHLKTFEERLALGPK